MSSYRLYIMDRTGRHIDDVAHIEAANDRCALEAARAACPRRPSELWLESRCVSASSFKA
jgi:1,2-phenylacetyl-CoA epoxidase PaaB subunit